MAKNNKIKFYIRIDNRLYAQFEEREGYEYKGIEGVKIGIHKENTSRWVATELSTGLYCGYARTKKELIANLTLNNRRIKEAVKQHDDCSEYVKTMNEFREKVQQ